jgi:uncharacterized membrane protein YecN with MAPEG domain
LAEVSISRLAARLGVAAIAQAALPRELTILRTTGRYAMTPIFPFYTAIYAAILGLLAAILTINVIVNRVRAKVNVSDGGVPALAKAIRAHGNFAEHTPLALLLIGFDEAFGYRSAIILTLGGVLLIARLLSAWGLNTSLEQTFGRQAGASLTVLATAVSAALILYAVATH